MIKIESLGFAYKKRPVFEQLSLSLKSGHIYGLLGKNGTGKSTLLRTLMGLLFPDSGKVDVFGHIPSRRRPAYLQEVFMVAEEFYLPPVSVKQFMQSNAPFYPAFDKDQFWAYLKEFEIPLSHDLDQMSYGQKKKVLICFALACNTRLLLMDEPTNGLDIISKSQFRKVMAAVATVDKCIIISTHQVRDLESLIDFITILDNGQIRFHHAMEAVQDVLHFGFGFGHTLPEDVLYSENALTGRAFIKKAAPGETNTGKVDLEMLYKAVNLNGAAIDQAFASKTITSNPFNE